jgi:hypothetical protein
MHELVASKRTLREGDAGSVDDAHVLYLDDPAQEQMLDMLAEKIGIDPLDFRIRNALTDDTPTVS